jgi:hypothetical protein
VTRAEASTDKRLLVASLAFVGALLSGGFAGGWLLSRHLTAAIPSAALERLPLVDRGDAPPAVRAQILQALALLQDGYSRRDLNRLPDLMERVFARDRDIALLGTDSGEWITGYDRVQSFIAGDWSAWGDLRLAVDRARISAGADFAWLATVGTVTFRAASRPIRFTAVMSRAGDHWVFRQLQFQWDEQTPALSDLLRPQINLRLQ